MKKVFIYAKKVLKFILITGIIFAIIINIAACVISIKLLHRPFYYTGLISVILFAIVLVYLIFKKLKKVCIISTVILILIYAPAIYDELKDIYIESITLSKSAVTINLDEYMPYDKNSKIVDISKWCTFKLESDLPIVDGAAALFPVYSSFVNAVYPQKIVEANYAKENANKGLTLEKLTYIFDSDLPWRDTDKLSYENVTKLSSGIFQYNNTVGGYRKLAEKETDIFFGVFPSEEQFNYATSHDTKFEFYEIGKDAFVFFVNKNNPINDITSEDVRKIYSGEITNWKEIGGNDEEIIAFQRNTGSGSQTRMIQFMGNVELKEPIREEYKISSMGDIINSVADYKNYRNSIGFSYRYYVEGIKANQNVKLLAINGVEPSIENIQNGTYQLITSLYAVTYEGNENSNVKKMIDWILSDEGQYIVEESGYVPIK